MASPAEVRNRICEALGDFGPIEVVNRMREQGLTGVDRSHLHDFMRGKKQSMGYDFTKELADFLGIDVEQLRIKKRPAVPTIRKGTKPHLYIAEHMEDRGWDDATLAGRLEDISPEAIKGWRQAPEKLADWQVQALLYAFGMEEPRQLAQPPIPKKRPAGKSGKLRRRA